jgi:hypothetical protein
MSEGIRRCPAGGGGGRMNISTCRGSIGVANGALFDVDANTPPDNDMADAEEVNPGQIQCRRSGLPY